MSSTSPFDALLRYRRTRLSGRLYLPLALLLLAAGAAAGGPMSAALWVGRFLLAGTLLVQFRLWDDLADLPHDRREHPERVLVQADSLTPFHAVLLAALIGSVLLLAWQGDVLRLLVFLALNAVFLAWYAGLRRVVPGVVLDYHVVLAKYPVFVFLLSAPPCRAGTLAAVAVPIYLGLCVYEVLHDARLRACRAALAALVLEAAALAIFVVFLAGSPLTNLLESPP